MSRWRMAKFVAAVQADEHDQKMIDAKIEVENFCNNTNKNYIVETLKKPSFWRILKCYLFMKVS